MHGALSGAREVFLWSLLGFVSGSVPYSLLLARAVSGTDVRFVGDGNPGAANAFRTAGWKAGVPALLLDFVKAALPTAAARVVGDVSGWALVPIGLAPAVGHAFSPFLRCRGGKALTATFGMWSGLALWQAPVVLGIFLTAFWALLDSDAWNPVLASAGLTTWLALSHHPVPFTVIGVLSTCLLAFRQGGALARPPRLRLSPRRERE